MSAESHREANKRWRERNPEKVLEMKRNWYARMRDEINKKQREKQRHRYANDKDFRMKKREEGWLRLYKITKEDYYSLYEQQKGCCAICYHTLEELGIEFFNIDHCHKTGSVRGLLCQPCNFLLGIAKDDAAILSQAAVYLKNKGA